MTRVIALLRGINIGRRRLAMADVRTGLTTAGCVDVATYLQSGNVVLTPPTEAGADLSTWLSRSISTQAGFEVGVVVRTPRQFDEVVARTPYPDAGGTVLHVVFCASAAPTDLVDGIDLDAVAPEHATVVGRHVYLYLPDGMGRARLPTLVERARGPGAPLATTRNWNTVLALREMARG